MVLSFLLVFFGIRSYRDNAGGGTYQLSAEPLRVGILITIVSCICYVITWEIIYFKFLPDFADKYSKARSIKRRPPAPARNDRGDGPGDERFHGDV